MDSENNDRQLVIQLLYKDAKKNLKIDTEVTFGQ